MNDVTNNGLQNYYRTSISIETRPEAVDTPIKTWEKFDESILNRDRKIKNHQLGKLSTAGEGDLRRDWIGSRSD